MHESGGFRFDREVWGPTPAQERYDIRADLGNTPARDGDGKLYRGRTAMQLTGKANYRSFHEWCVRQGYHPPDFVADPDKVNTDPWEGLVPIWYWSTRDLNRWADQNDIETITKRINGGKNGLAERIEYFGRLALVVCGYGVSSDEVRRFQQVNGLAVDGDIGPKTRAALFKVLLARSGSSKDKTLRSAPVVEERVVETAKPVVPVAVDKEVKEKANIGAWFSGVAGVIGGLGSWLANANPQTIAILLLAGAVCACIILFGGAWIVRRVKAIRQEIEA
jgi:putative chitinase